MDIPQSGELFENDDWDEIFNLKSEFDTSMTPEENTMIGETSTVSTSPKQSGSGRFKPVPKKDVETLASKTTEKTTNDQTKWAVKIFREWLHDTRNHETNFENLEPSELDKLLSKFYASLQTAKGKDYSKSALVGIRAGINRHITSPPFQRQINTIKDRAFMKSNQVLIGLIKQMKRDGKYISENKEPVTHNDLKMNESGLLCLDNPKSLQNKVIFDIMTHFGRRGREGPRALNKASFKLSTDTDGHSYLGMTFNKSDKTHHGIDSREKNKAPRMYETGSETCPLKAFEKYMSKLNPDCEALFQKPLIKFQPDSDTWYSKTPVGVNNLYNFMSRMSSEAGLSKRYTNHCILAMVASNLCEAGVSNQGIMSVTEHRNVQRLNSYIRTSDKERLAISGILAGKSDNQVAIRSPNVAVASSQNSSFNLSDHYPTPPIHKQASIDSLSLVQVR